MALALGAMGTLELFGGASFHFAQGGLAVALCLVTTLPLALRRRAPIVVAGAVGVGLLLQVVFHQAAPAGSFFALLVTAYTLAVAVTAPAAVGAVLVLLAVVTPHIWENGHRPDSGDVIFTYLPPLICFTGGVLQRSRLLRIAGLRTELGRADESARELAARAVLEERTRIARELHDVVAHRVSVITMQAAAAGRLAPAEPQVAIDALALIEAQGREALAEMRRLLDVMRLHGAGGPVLAPQPTLGELDDLVGTVRAAGLDVDLHVHGDRRPLAPGLDLSAYRIVQEALTNVMKHAAGAAAQVTVRYGPRDLELDVVNGGGSGSHRAAARASGGHGLVGIRERVALFGGTVKAGPDRDGFRVRALLPIE